MSEYITHSRAETVALGKPDGRSAGTGALIAFTGGLGAGKTAFTEGLCRGPGLHRPGVQPNLCHRELLPRPAPAGAL